MFADHNRIEIEHADDPARKIAETHRLGRATRARLGPPKADLELLVAHMLHVVDLVGVDHIGIGSDLDGVFDLPREVPDCSAYPRILARLARELGDEDAVRRIAWGNFLRVLRATEG
jgi:membrane dipeptidase